LALIAAWCDCVRREHATRSAEFGAPLHKQFAQQAAVAVRLVDAIAADREIGVM
jgi:hypothetical protein